jgi:hypothetical protein
LELLYKPFAVLAGLCNIRGFNSQKKHSWFRFGRNPIRRPLAARIGRTAYPGLSNSANGPAQFGHYFFRFSFSLLFFFFLHFSFSFFFFLFFFFVQIFIFVQI